MRDAMYSDENWDSNPNANSHRLQEAAYRQLGRQTHLKEPQLGHEHVQFNATLYEDYFQWHCLEITLQSKLYHLRYLKEFRLLDVSHMHRGIGAAELEWMKVNWSLEMLTGVFKSGKVPDPVIEDWIEAKPSDLGGLRSLTRVAISP
ncbi:hypothetical protein MVEG_09652 [Podila verticillata NRRL 6337]|nr:hypothetical protein MVEG_09652 [Podila verticillata NRRL 6337]